METFRNDFTRTLSERDSKQNIPFSVQVPGGTMHIKIRFTFAPEIVDDIQNLLTLTVFDPSGWRGAGHRHSELTEVLIGEDYASPGYLTGQVQAGMWTVVVDTHMVMPGVDCDILLQVSGSNEPIERRWVPLKAGRTASRGRGWYRGDLHAHTIHSDAVWDVPDLVAYARAQHLDFATLSDHNTVSGLAQMDAACADDLLTMGGLELTTFWGHALALGLRDWVDWRVHTDGRTMEQIEAEVTQRGGLFIIAHPKGIGDPYCTGCGWVYPSIMPGPARVVEVWNTNWISESNNEAGLELAFDWMNQGYRLALTSGADNHGRNPELMHYGFNLVYADDLSEREILRAIRAGHLYLSAGPKLKLEAEAGDQRAMMGDVLKVAGDTPIGLTFHCQDNPPGAQLDFIVDGGSKERLPALAGETHTFELKGGQAHWCLLTLRASSGEMLALTNPIYFDGRA
jgi:hypothetical protein